MKQLKLTLKKEGVNNFNDIREKLSDFVKENWRQLYRASKKLKRNGDDSISVYRSDYWAPERVQIEDTRLHRDIGVKYADGVKYNEDIYTSKPLEVVVSQLQKIIDASTEDIGLEWSLYLSKKQRDD